VVSTTDHWSKHAEDALNEQHVPITRLRVQDLDESAVDWSKFSLAKPDNVQLRSKKKLRKHQKLAITKVTAGFQAGDRGKLIMACGTGKTFTSLKLMESLVPDKGLALFLVPSISLLSQTLKEWMAESEHELRSFAICSDTKVGKDQEDIAVNDLAYPATTDAKKLLAAISELPKGDKRVTVIFSTY
jgi:predicted helicase